MTVVARCLMRFGKFSAVGALGAVLQVTLFDSLVRFLDLPGLAAAPFAVEIAVLHNFFWHERFTWRDRRTGGRGKALRLWRFHVSNGLVSLAANTALAYWLIEKLHFPALPFAIIAIAVCAPLNFLIADRWVYGRYRTATVSV